MLTALRPGILASVIGVCMLLQLARASAEADDGPAVEKITTLNQRAVDEYQNLNFDEARNILKEALDAAKGAGLDTHPVTARTYVHLGVVMLAGFKQKDEAVKLFRKALGIEPDIKLDKALANPEIQDVYNEAAASQQAGDSGGGESREISLDAKITHEPVTQASRGSAIPIRATVDAHLGAKRVFLSFKADGAGDFAEREMKETSPGAGNWAVVIPVFATLGGAIEYFIEALADDDKVVASKGSAEKPLRIALLAAPSSPSLVEPAKEPSPPESKQDWYFGLGLGSGFGWTTGKGEVTDRQLIPSGFELAGLAHLAPEVGYFVNPNMLISVQLRLQLVTGGSSFYGSAQTGCGSDGICSPAWNAVAGFGRVSFFLGQGKLRPYVAGIVGLGQIRHVAKFDAVQICGKSGMDVCTDTVVAGPLFVGAGGGVVYDLAAPLALTLGANAAVGFTAFTFNIDVNAGVAMYY
jgi:Tfp pilus assembly protein PilF